MPPYQAFNITKQLERITLEPSEINRPPVDEIINKPSIVTNVIMPPAGNTFGLREYICYGLKGLQPCTDAQMPRCQTSTFTSDGVNTIKQPEGITLEPTKMVNVPAEVQEITNGRFINKSSIITNDTRPAIS
jgi:hypothetical protein